MRVSRQQAAENRQRIVDAASRLFREHGFDGVGIDAVMKEAGLTHGGFYGHFASKDALIVEAVVQAMDASLSWQEGVTEPEALVAAYLSSRHCTERAGGCAIAALGADYARQSRRLRRAVADGVRRQVDRIAGLFHRGTAATRRRHAIATYAGLVGALTLARAVDDPALAEEILAVARESFGKEPEA